jgi:hypothetical protein
VTFEEDAGAYDQKDAQGFIQLNALRLKLLAARNRRPALSIIVVMKPSATRRVRAVWIGANALPSRGAPCALWAARFPAPRGPEG